MKKLFGLFIILLSINVCADMPDIVASVNDYPITRHDFESRKDLIISLNNVDLSEPFAEMKLNSQILDSLIDEELLNQHAQKIGANITREQLDKAILSVEERNNMQPGGMAIYLQERGLDIETYRRQIRAEMIKQNIVNSMSYSVSVSENEVDTVLNNAKNENYDIEAWVFTSKSNSEKNLNQMKSLRSKLKSCDKMNEKAFEKFADAEKFDRKFSKLPDNTKSVIMDTKVGSFSPVYKEDDSFKLVFVCKKDRTITSAELTNLETSLSNRKTSQKALKLFKDLRSKAYINIMMPNM